MNPNQLYISFQTALAVDDLAEARKLKKKLWDIYQDGHEELKDTVREMESQFLIRFSNWPCKPSPICAGLRKQISPAGTA